MQGLINQIFAEVELKAVFQVEFLIILAELGAAVFNLGEIFMGIEGVVDKLDNRNGNVGAVVGNTGVVVEQVGQDEAHLDGAIALIYSRKSYIEHALHGGRKGKVCWQIVGQYARCALAWCDCARCCGCEFATCYDCITAFEERVCRVARGDSDGTLDCGV